MKVGSWTQTHRDLPEGPWQVGAEGACAWEFALVSLFTKASLGGQSLFAHLRC